MNPREEFERLTYALLVGAVIAFASGSSSLRWFLIFGRPIRWLALALLCASALLFALTAERGRRPPRTLMVLASTLLALAVGSAAWSVDAALTLEHSLAFAVVLVTAASISYACAGRPDAVRRTLAAILAAIVAVAAISVLVLAVDPDAALQEADTQAPTRFRGFGENPNTIGILLALGVPLAVSLALEAATTRARVGALLLAAGLDAELVATGSRASVLATLAGLLVLAAAAPSARRAAAIALAAVGLFGLNTFASSIPEPKPPRPPAGASAPIPTTNAEDVRSLDSDVGRGTHIRRTLLGTSGRSQAWAGAFEHARDRPFAGYGFGTEENVFVDRYYAFYADLPESSYLDGLLQLGVVGAAILVALLLYPLVVFARMVRARSPAERSVAGACGAIVAAGATLGLFQSYLFAPGNVAMASVWICVFLMPAAARTPRR